MQKLKETFVQDKEKLIKLVFSLISVYGIIGTYEIYGKSLNLSNSFLNILIFVAIFVVYNHIKPLNKKEKVFAYIFSMLLGIVLVVGSQLEFYSDILWTFVTLLKIICLSIAIYPITNITINYLNQCNIKNINHINNKKLFIIVFVIIFIFDFLVFLAIYPGKYGYDAGFQIMEFLDKDTGLTSHFSLLYSFILAKIVNLGNVLFGSYQIGFAIYCFLQMVFLDYVATRITVFTINKTKNIYLGIFSVLFFSFFPLYTVMILSSSQDPIFAGIFALIILNLIDLEYNADYWQKKHKPILLGVLLLLLCLIRNNGFFTTLVALPFVLIFNKHRRILTLIVFLIPIILYKIYNGPILDYMKVTKENEIREMLSIPSQQIARVYNYNKNIFTEEEIDELNNYYFKMEDFEYYTYRQSISDLIKGILDNDYVNNNKIDYFKFWIKTCIKDPENYIEAFLLNSLGIWYPNKDYNDTRMYHPYIEYEMLEGKEWNEKYLDIDKDSKFKAYDKLLDKTLGNNAWKRVPVISTIFTTGTYFWIVIFLFGLVIVRKNLKVLVPLGMIIGLYATLFLGPVALYRYCFPIVILLPVLLSLIFEKKELYLNS